MNVSDGKQAERTRTHCRRDDLLGAIYACEPKASLSSAIVDLAGRGATRWVGGVNREGRTTVSSLMKAGAKRETDEEAVRGGVTKDLSENDVDFAARTTRLAFGAETAGRCTVGVVATKAAESSQRGVQRWVGRTNDDRFEDRRDRGNDERLHRNGRLDDSHSGSGDDGLGGG